MEKKPVTLLLILCCLFGISSAIACNKITDGAIQEELVYELSADKTYYIVSSATLFPEEKIIIPEKYKDLPVKEIRRFAFLNCTNLKSVTIGDSVTAIGNSAFANCNRLTNVYYEGNENDWNKISIGGNDNYYLTSATRYYYSENQPTDEGNYWRYVDGVATPW